MPVNSKPSLFSYSNLAHAVAGGCGSAVAMTAFYPLDIVRTKQQLSKDKDIDVVTELKKIHHTEGWHGLYKGLLPVVESLYCSNFVYFYSFHGLNQIWNPDKSIIRNLVLGMIAGSINVITTTPLWVVNTRIKMQGKLKEEERQQTYSGLLDGLLKIYKLEGLSALWSGTVSSLILVINPAIQYTVYEALKKRLVEVNGSPNSAMVFLMGALAKIVSTVITYPLQLVQTIHRHGGIADNEKRNLIGLILYIIRLQGPKGLYKGLRAKLLQTVLTTALMFVCYEKIQAIVLTLMRGQRETLSIIKN